MLTSITPRAFMAAVFLDHFTNLPALPKGIVAAVGSVTLKDDPVIPDKQKIASMPASGWNASPINPDRWYWTGCLYHGHDTLPVERTHDNAIAAICSIADDVHEKARPFPLAPFARIETKPGSEHWTLAYDDYIPVEDARLIARMLKAGGWSDKDGNSAVRYGRLPNATVPPLKTFAAKLVHLDPKARHRPLDVMTVLWSALTPAQRNAVDKEVAHAAMQFTGALQDDLLLKWLADNALLRSTMEDGYVKCVCPRWQHHTDQDKGGTSYRTGTTYTKREFICRHKSCRDLSYRKADAFLDWKLQNAPIDNSTGFLIRHSIMPTDLKLARLSLLSLTKPSDTARPVLSLFGKRNEIHA